MILSNDNQKKQLLDLLEKESNEDRKIEAVVKLYKELGIPQLTENLIRGYYEKAFEAFNSLDKTKKEKENLQFVAEMLMQRIH